MAQYRTGTASVTNGSSTVTGSGTAWIGNVTQNDLFVYKGVVYTVAADAVSDTELFLTAPYAGTSEIDVGYVIHRDFNNLGIPLMQDGDLETVALYNELVKYVGDNDGFVKAGNNGSDFTDIEQLRENIDVYSKNETDVRAFAISLFL